MSALEQGLVKALDRLPHTGWTPMHLGIFHWIRGMLLELQPQDRPPEVVEAFRRLHGQFFPRDACPL